MRQALQEAGLEKLLEACKNTVKKLDPEARLSMALSDFTCKEWQFDEDLFPFLPLIGVWGHMHMIAFSTYPAEQIVAVDPTSYTKESPEKPSNWKQLWALGILWRTSRLRNLFVLCIKLIASSSILGT